MKDVVIIGGGPAGLTAAIYFARSNVQPVVIEKELAGGKVGSTDLVENYPGVISIKGFDLAEKLEAHAKANGVEFMMGEVTRITKEKTGFRVELRGEVVEAKVVVIATGMKNRRLGVPGEDDYSGRGVSWCAICDGRFFQDEDVIVVGGGNSALEGALYMANIARSVTLVQNLEYLTGEALLQKQVAGNSKIKVLLGETIKEFAGDNFGLTHVELASGRKLQASGVFEYIGQTPEPALYAHLGIADAAGYIETDENQETKVKGLFAAGDICAQPFRQIVIAQGQGAIAALAAIKEYFV